MALEIPEVRTRRFSVDEFNRVGEQGFFNDESRVELIEGEIIEMGPIGPSHAGTPIRLVRVFLKRLGERAVISPQNPAVMDERNEPLPDLVVARPRWDDYSRSAPRAEDLLLVVEVSDSTVGHDTRKMGIYARNGVPESWMVQVKDATVGVFSEPSPTGYRLTRTYARGEAILLGAFPDISIPIGGDQPTRE